jgi:hypothetical protein
LKLDQKEHEEDDHHHLAEADERDDDGKLTHNYENDLDQAILFDENFDEHKPQKH